MTDEKPTQIVNVTSYNQSGGVTAGTYINQAPEPKLHTLGESDWKDTGDGKWEKRFAVKLENPANVSKLTVGVSGPDVVGVGFAGDGMVMNGNGGNQEGYAWMELLTPNTLRGIVVFATQPTQLDKLEAQFE